MPPRINPTIPTRIDSTSNGPVLPQQAIDTFNQQVESIFHHDALSLAQGLTPTREGDPISDDQRKQLAAATKTLLLSLPVGALSPELADKLEASVKPGDFGGKSISDLPLSSLGDVGRSVAEQFASELRDGSPATFYALAAASAGAIGYLGYSQGSAGLEKFGIRPEAKLKLFGDKLAVKARVDWDPHFTNLTASGSVTSSFDLGDYTHVDGELKLNRDGFDGGSVAATYARDNLSVTGRADFNKDGFDSASVVASYTRNNLELDGRATIDRDGKASAGVDAIYRPRDNFEVAGSASVDSTGDARVGVGVKIRF